MSQFLPFWRVSIQGKAELMDVDELLKHSVSRGPRILTLQSGRKNQKP